MVVPVGHRARGEAEQPEGWLAGRWMDALAPPLAQAEGVAASCRGGLFGSCWLPWLQVFPLRGCCAHPSFSSAPPCAVAEEGDTRLVFGSSIPGMAWGRLEVRGTPSGASETWGTVCGDSYSYSFGSSYFPSSPSSSAAAMAQVACRSLGLPDGQAFVVDGLGGYGQGYILMGEVSCVGYEDSLQECASNTNTASCSHTLDVSVFCLDVAAAEGDGK